MLRRVPLYSAIKALSLISFCTLLGGGNNQLPLSICFLIQITSCFIYFSFYCFILLFSQISSRCWRVEPTWFEALCEAVSFFLWNVPRIYSLCQGRWYNCSSSPGMASYSEALGEKFKKHSCRGPVPVDPGNSKQGRCRRGSGNNCLIKC